MSLAASPVKTGLLAVYLRREPTTDREATHGPQRGFFDLRRPKYFDVVAYRAPPDAGAQPVARWRWDRTDKPRRWSKRVVLNCFTWATVWLPDHKGA